MEGAMRKARSITQLQRSKTITTLGEGTWIDRRPLLHGFCVILSEVEIRSMKEISELYHHLYILVEDLIPLYRLDDLLEIVATHRGIDASYRAHTFLAEHDLIIR